MVSKKGMIEAGISIGWILVFFGGTLMGLKWWVWLVVGLGWLVVKKWPRVLWLFLPVLFLVNLHILGLFGIERVVEPNFNLEKINITSPGYEKIIERYEYDDVWIPYSIRGTFYGEWMKGILWLDSMLVYLSPIFWLRTLGMAGLAVLFLGVYEYWKKNKRLNWAWWWFIGVVMSCGLGIMVDSKTAVVLALPAIGAGLYGGLKSSWASKYWYVLVVIGLIDLIVR